MRTAFWKTKFDGNLRMADATNLHKTSSGRHVRSCWEGYRSRWRVHYVTVSTAGMACANFAEAPEQLCAGKRRGETL